MNITNDPVKGATYSDFIPPEELALPPGFMLTMERYPGKKWVVKPQGRDSGAPLGSHDEECKWAGEGYPPVGTKCQRNSSSILTVQRWETVTIIGHTHDGRPAWESADGKYAGITKIGSAHGFRPMPTYEQAALAEIEHAVDGYNVDIDCSAAISATVKAMLDAGYRKQEQSK